MKKEKINFSASPLPFMGQKRNFVTKFKKELQRFDDELVFVDLFGGSGILSHVAKQEKPNSRVIYNDYDNFQLRLKSIDVTNKILDFARKSLVGYKKGEKISPSDKVIMLDFIKSKQEELGYIDYLSVGSQLLFSGKYVQSYTQLSKETFYFKIRKSNFATNGYLEGVESVRVDYKNLFERYRNTPNVVFIVDPPYFQTQSIGYKNTWNLQQHLECLNVLDASKFFYFTSSKSGIMELMEWVYRSTLNDSPFKGCNKLSHRQGVNYGSSYEDVMFVKNEE